MFALYLIRALSPAPPYPLQVKNPRSENPGYWSRNKWQPPLVVCTSILTMDGAMTPIGSYLINSRLHRLKC